MGGTKSVAKLEQLGFDPISKLVDTYRYLENEIAQQEAIRDGKLVLYNNNGRARSYSFEVHHNLIDKLITISEKLLRYRYGRVPELGNEEKTKFAASMVIELTKRGDTYVIGDEQPDLVPAGVERNVP